MARHLEALRWTLDLAAKEFQRDYKTLAGRVKALSIEPGSDKKYSTADIARAVFGDIEAEKLRKTREEADKIALENEKTRGTLIEAEAVYKHFEGVFVAFRQKVLASLLSDEEKDELLNDLRKLKDRIFTN